MTDKLAKKKQARFRFLHKLYEDTDGNEQVFLSDKELGRELDFSSDETAAIVQYLEGERLIESMTMVGHIKLTHSGVIEVENALANPDRATAHFPPGIINILHVGSMTNSQIQQGSIESVQAQTNISLNSLEQAVEKVLEAIRASGANDDQKELAEAHADTIISQARIPKEQRNTALAEKAWDKLRKLSTVVSLGKFAIEAAPIVSAFFGF